MPDAKIGSIWRSEAEGSTVCSGFFPDRSRGISHCVEGGERIESGNVLEIQLTTYSLDRDPIPSAQQSDDLATSSQLIGARVGRSAKHQQQKDIKIGKLYVSREDSMERRWR